MIHTVELSDSIKQHLSEIVYLQIELLRYAASQKQLNQHNCGIFLDNIPQFQGRGTAIARWIWDSRNRHEPLENFAAGAIKRKNKLLRRVKVDVYLFNLGAGSIRTLGLPQSQWKRIPKWQQGVWTFLQNFYSNLNSNTGFPAYIFSSNTSFNAQKFLSEFINLNRKLSVCPACDETDYRTHREAGILSEKDHYLPQSLYPHLACHPFNLVPICHYCNQPKSNKDLLKSTNGKRYNLNDILLPYQEKGLGSRTYLKIIINKKIEASQFVKIKPQYGGEIQKRVEAFRNVYEIPDRWGNPTRLDQLGERLFERIFDELKNFPIGFIDRKALLSVLDKLLNVLYQEQGKEPHRYAQTWLLAALINQEIEPVVIGVGATLHKSALLQEVELRFEQERELYPNPTELDELIEYSRSLLSSASHRSGIQAAQELRQLANEELE